MIKRKIIFICATPYHVLLGNLICIQMLKETVDDRDVDCTLVLTNAAQVSNVDKLIFKPLWNKVVKMPFSSSRTQLMKKAKELDSWCNKELSYDNGDVVEVFLACDTDWTHQFIVTFYKDRIINLFEDGIGSYTDDGKRDSLWGCFLRKVAYGLILKRRYINCKGLGRMPASHYYSIQDSAFLHIKNIESKRKVIAYELSYIEYLRQGIPMELKNNNKLSLIITQPMTESNFVEFDQEIKAYTAIGNYFSELDVMLFLKRHPAEADDLHKLRCEAIEKALGRSIQYLNDINPLEMYFISGVKMECIAGVMSTALVSAKHFNAAKDVVSAFNYLDEDSKHTYRGYKNMLGTAGCLFI